MNLLSIHPLVKYKQFLMDLQLTLVTDSLLAAGVITYSLASTRWLQCLQCAIPETWYFSMLLKTRSSDRLSSHPSSKTTGQSWEPANWRLISAENLPQTGIIRGADLFWKVTPSCGCWALGKLSIISTQATCFFLYEQLSGPCLRPVSGELDASVGFFLSESLDHK